jgi:hypothetical protein
MTCAERVINYFRLVVLMAAILAVPITKVPANHPLVAESDKHAGCSDVVPKKGKSSPSCCVISFVVIEPDVLSFSSDLLVHQLKLIGPEEGKGIVPEPLKKPPRAIA